MKYYVLNRGDAVSLQLTEKFHALAAQRGLSLDKQSPDIVVSIGGDGTMLHAFHTFSHRIDDISFVGVHTGHLGFYSDWTADEIEQLVHLIAETPSSIEHEIVEYPIVDIQIQTDQQTMTYLALNELTIKGIAATLVAEVHINNNLFEMFRGDGICISTPSGSTAYNKSLGGAMVHPSLEAIQIAEIASINNRVYRTLGSSILLPKHHQCDIYPRAGQKILLTVDHLQIEIDDIQSIRTKVAEQKVRFARYRPYPFWSRVKRAFIGNELN